MSDEFRISSELAEEMVQHCIEGRPNEACGMLGIKDGTVVKIFRMTNALRSPVRYRLDSTEQLAVHNTLYSEGWDWAAFHSHTHTEAYPSPTDIREKRDDVPYVIVSLATDPPEIRAFRIEKEDWAGDEGVVQEIPVTILP
ncbi:MAG: hypothetical protein GEU68_06395 [Actinobacteria bacterium]|nr:hypothetical protein [Actinomycetota bacterium]